MGRRRMSGLKEKAKFGKDIFKTLADAFRENYDLWNSLQFEEWVRLEDVEAECQKCDYREVVRIRKEEARELKQKLQQFAIFLDDFYKRRRNQIVRPKFYEIFGELLKEEKEAKSP
jgi:hypothetical protein